MYKPNLVIIGSSGHAKVIIDIFEKQNSHVILGLLDDYRSPNEETLNYKVLGGINSISELAETYDSLEVFVAIGDNWARSEMVKQIENLSSNIQFPNAIHPSVQLANKVTLGRGIAIMAGVIVNSDSNIGDFCFLNTKSSADHDTQMDNYSSLGPSVTLGGNVSIGAFSALSIGVTTIEKVKIGKHSIIGAGALLLSDCPDNSIMYGVPAQYIRLREIGEKYLY